MFTAIMMMMKQNFRLKNGKEKKMHILTMWGYVEHFILKKQPKPALSSEYQ
jgi:hypothetical protein